MKIVLGLFHIMVSLIYASSNSTVHFISNTYTKQRGLSQEYNYRKSRSKPVNTILNLPNRNEIRNLQSKNFCLI